MIRSFSACARGAITVLAGAVLLLVPVLGASRAGSTPGSVSSPEVSGQVTGGAHGYAYNAWPWSLAPHGYRQDEYFVSGTAHAYGVARPDAGYTIRIQVFRPVDPARFSGTAIVEWNNETGQGDIPIDWNWLHPWVMATGDVYVTASVQEVSACGVAVPDTIDVHHHAIVLPACSPLSLKAWDPVRYAPLAQPGDDYAYDIYSQVVQAVRSPRGISPTGGLNVRHVLAAGESQSAQQLDVYLCNGADAAARVIDGALIDADFARYLTCAPRVPTIRTWSEESATRGRGGESPTLRVWMLPGAAHLDNWEVVMVAATIYHNETGATLISEAPAHALAEDYGQQGISALAGVSCVPGDQYPRHDALDAATLALQRWVTDGRVPPEIPAIRFSGPDLNAALPLFTPPTALARDHNGNAIGGLRSPVLDVPVAAYVGATCALFGQTIPLPGALLGVMYHSHAQYVAKFAAAADADVAAGYLLVSDGNALLDVACGSEAGGRDLLACPRVTAVSPYGPA